MSLLQDVLWASYTCSSHFFQEQVNLIKLTKFFEYLVHQLKRIGVKATNLHRRKTGDFKFISQNRLQNTYQALVRMH